MQFKSRYYNKKKKQYTYVKPGHLLTHRWSAKDLTNCCHVQYTGNDVNNSADVTAQFTLADASGSAELVQLFDNFRLTKIMYRWVITRTPDWNSTTGVRGYSVRVTWVHDFNDSTPISRLAQLQRSGCREEMLNVDKPESKWYTLNPAVAMQAYESATTTAYAPKWRQWLDTNDNSAPHYGLKATYSELNTGNALRLEAKMYFEFKGVV